MSADTEVTVPTLGTLEHAARAARVKAALETEGLCFGDCINFFGSEGPWVQAAKQIHTDEGQVEVDLPAVVSEGADDGAYVMAWVWVSARAFVEAGGVLPTPYIEALDDD